LRRVRNEYPKFSTIDIGIQADAVRTISHTYSDRCGLAARLPWS